MQFLVICRPAAGGDPDEFARLVPFETDKTAAPGRECVRRRLEVRRVSKTPAPDGCDVRGRRMVAYPRRVITRRQVARSA